MIKLYTNGCPQCMLLERVLSEKHLEFEKITDEEVLATLDTPSIPQMQVDDGPIMLFPDALRYTRGI